MKAQPGRRPVPVAEWRLQLLRGELANVSGIRTHQKVELGHQLRGRQRVHDARLEVEELDDIVD